MDSSNHSVRSHQHMRRNRPDLLRRFQIDDKFFGERMRVSLVVNSFAAEFFGFLRYFGFPESIHFLETNSPTLPQACRN